MSLPDEYRLQGGTFDIFIVRFFVGSSLESFYNFSQKQQSSVRHNRSVGMQ